MQILNAESEISRIYHFNYQCSDEFTQSRNHMRLIYIKDLL